MPRGGCTANGRFGAPTVRSWPANSGVMAGLRAPGRKSANERRGLPRRAGSGAEGRRCPPGAVSCLPGSGRGRVVTRPGRKRAARKTGDGIRAWLFLRHVEAYLAAWRAHGVLPGPEPGSEPGPFPIRIQTAADLEADRFDLLAWADPDAADGPASPFWIQSGMAEAVVDPKAEPLLAQVAADGGAVEGLRLAGGDLVLKIECAGTVVQIRVRGSAPFPEDGGIDIRHRFAMRMPPTMGRMVDFWSLAGLPAPRTGRGRRARTGLS